MMPLNFQACADFIARSSLSGALRGALTSAPTTSAIGTSRTQSGAAIKSAFGPFATVPETCSDVACQGQPRHGRHGVKSTLLTRLEPPSTRALWPLAGKQRTPTTAERTPAS